MKLKLRTILISIVVIFALLIVVRVTKIYQPVFSFLKAHGNQVILFLLLLAAGVGVYFLFKNRRANEDLSGKCFQYLNRWWCDVMGINEELKLEDAIIKEGWYSNQKFYGFNVTKKNSNARFIGIVGVSPMRVAYCLNAPGISEDADPFSYFFKQAEPTPTADYNESRQFWSPSATYRRESFEPRANRRGRTYIEGADLDEEELLEEKKRRP